MDRGPLPRLAALLPLVLAGTLQVVGCGGAPTTPPARAPPARALAPSPAPAAEPLEPAEVLDLDAERARDNAENARLVGLLEPTVVAALPGARVVAIEPTSANDGVAWVEGPGFRIALKYSARERDGGHPHFNHEDVLEHMSFLLALSEGGVDLARTGREFATEENGTIRCTHVWGEPPGIRCHRVADPIEPTARATLEPPDYLLPPSRRRRRRGTWPPRPRRASASAALPPASVAPITEAIERHRDLTLVGVPLDADHRALLVTEVGGGGLLCVRSAESPTPRLTCAPTYLDDLEGTVAAPDWGWLLVGSASYGNPRDSSYLLIALRPSPEEGLAMQTLELGGVSGDGDLCDDDEGHCVDMTGVAYRARVLSPQCVERRPGAEWSSTQVRFGGRVRWIDEVVTEPPVCVERYAIEASGFEPTDCGPPSDVPRCHDPRDDEAAEE